MPVNSIVIYQNAEESVKIGRYVHSFDRLTLKYPVSIVLMGRYVHHGLHHIRIRSILNYNRPIPIYDGKRLQYCI